MAQAKVKADVPIEALLKEKRKFAPPKGFVQRAVMNKKAIYAEAQRNPVKFWEGCARELHWFKPWKKALEWKPPYAKWFIGGKLNVSDNCLDRHVDRKSTRLNSSHLGISYAVFCLKKKINTVT